MKTKMTIVLTETGELTAGVLEVARVARAITLSRERIAAAEVEIIRTTTRLKAHLTRFRAALKQQRKKLAAQQRELRRQINRVNQLKGAKP